MRASSLIAIFKRMILHDVEQVRRRHVCEVGVQIAATKRLLRLSDRRFQKSEITNLGRTSEFCDLVGVYLQDLIQRQKDRVVAHFASFRNSLAFFFPVLASTFLNISARSLSLSGSTIIFRPSTVILTAESLSSSRRFMRERSRIKH